MKQTLSLTLLALLALAWACGDNFSHAGVSPALFRNDTLPFPFAPYNSIKAYTLDHAATPDGKPLSVLNGSGKLPAFMEGGGTELSPAHRADLRVGLALPPDTLLSPHCFQPRHILVYADQSAIVGALSLSFDCQSYRFEPPSPHQLGPNNLRRLQLIFTHP